jgi:hypothetical protein
MNRSIECPLKIAWSSPGADSGATERYRAYRPDLREELQNPVHPTDTFQG